jgi:hypothetical protein
MMTFAEFDAAIAALAGNNAYSITAQSLTHSADCHRDRVVRFSAHIITGKPYDSRTALDGDAATPEAVIAIVEAKCGAAAVDIAAIGTLPESTPESSTESGS